MAVQPTSLMAMHVIGFLLRIVSAVHRPFIHANVSYVPVSWACAQVQPSGGLQELRAGPRAGGQHKQPHKFSAELQHPTVCPQTLLAAMGPTVVLRVPFFLLHSHRDARELELHCAWAEFYFV